MKNENLVRKLISQPANGLESRKTHAIEIGGGSSESCILFHNHITLNLDTFFLLFFFLIRTVQRVSFSQRRSIFWYLSIEIRYMSADMAPELKITFQIEIEIEIRMCEWSTLRDRDRFGRRLKRESRLSC